MLIDEEVLDELYESAGADREARARRYVDEKRVKIGKITYENEGNFELRSYVNGNSDMYAVHIHIKDYEIEDVSCECPDYEKHYGACKHILATMMEFESNPKYELLFGKQKLGNIKNNEVEDIFSNRSDDKHQIFKQLIHTFYNQPKEESESKQLTIAQTKSIKLEPKLIYGTYQDHFKVQFKIGDKQLYKLKNLPQFFDCMLKNENYRYGTKLEFVHNESAFSDESIPLLKFVLKYAEIIKYANETASVYNHYGTSLGQDSVMLSNTGIDELFDILKNTYVLAQNEYGEEKIYFTDEQPDIKFLVEDSDNGEYKITTNIDMYDYRIFDGKNYIYFLYKNKLHRCNKEFKKTVLELVNFFRENYIKEIKLGEKDLSELFSIVFPKVKDNVILEKLNKEKVEKYIPKELYVKLFLDVTENNYVVADVKFVYGNKEINPFGKEQVQVARNIPKENEMLNIFLTTGFLFDTANERLILVDDDKIYNFLQNDIEKYMQKFEVLATDNFKKREIREPKIGSLGVRIENNLLNIDFSNIDFSFDELSEIMEKYRLKKKYHRLKDGSFLKLEENDTMNFISNLTDGIGIDFKEIKKGELNLPVYRSMYLERLLQNMKGTNVSKDKEYKELIRTIDNKEIDEEIPFPKKLNADLRTYQQTGFKWLSMLDKYKLGGILADDMGLGKTVQMLAVVLAYVENTKNSKPSIVVCPSSLCLNWENEIRRFAPTIKSIVIHGNIEERTKQIKSIPNYNVVITSYDLLKRDIDIYEEQNYVFKFIIADEAQYIKNNNTQNAKAIKKINSETRYALTGTPIENSLSELWSIFDFIMPGYLFGYKKFKELYEVPIAKDNDINAMNKLKMLIEPFVLRRIKKEVLTELPDKTITVLNNEMQGEQLKIYASYMASAKKEAAEEISANGLEKSQIKILALLMRLRQICCHPSLFINNYTGESGKLNQCIEVVKDAVSAGHKILLFSGYTSMFEILEKELQKQEIKYFKLTGKTKVGERIKLVDEFNANDDIKVFLISLKAGGTGLNLIGADMVIHYDPWWNLSAENQATDRTYRIGQRKNVQVCKLITKNSIEEKIYELQQRKAKLADNMLSTNETFISKLSKDDIMALFE